MKKLCHDTRWMEKIMVHLVPDVVGSDLIVTTFKSTSLCYLISFNLYHPDKPRITTQILRTLSPKKERMNASLIPSTSFSCSPRPRRSTLNSFMLAQHYSCKNPNSTCHTMLYCHTFASVWEPTVFGFFPYNFACSPCVRNENAELWDPSHRKWR